MLSRRGAGPEVDLLVNRTIRRGRGSAYYRYKSPGDIFRPRKYNGQSNLYPKRRYKRHRKPKFRLNIVHVNKAIQHHKRNQKIRLHAYQNQQDLYIQLAIK
jgi:hypothetical protein